MSRSDFESPVSIKLLSPGREPALFSAMLERDPHFLHWNRISLIGSKDDYRRFLPISKGQMEWELYNSPDWPSRDDNQSEYRTSGVAILTRSGRASGISIARDGIQKFAELTIQKSVETLKVSDERTSAVFSFLQRPSSWTTYPKRLVNILHTRGEWRSVPSLGLKLRLISTGHLHQDARETRELQLLEIPGVEIRPATHMPAEEFCSAAGDLWFSIRILLVYCFRQPIALLFERVSTENGVTTTCYRIAIEPKSGTHHTDDYGFFGRVDDFLAQATPRLATCSNQRGVLHAAAWGYAASYTSTAMETQLTNCVEAIERLITVYEKLSGLSRSTREKWESVKIAIEKFILKSDFDQEMTTFLTKHFLFPPPMSLSERIERMASQYSDRWNQEERDLFEGIRSTIDARNTIVHGRLVESANRLHIELLRSRAIFEKLFMSFLGCSEMHSSSHIKSWISSLERQAAGDEDI